jgi:hypothetical protein
MPAVSVVAIAIASVAMLAGSSPSRTVSASAAKPASASQASATAEQRGRIRASFGALPLAFEANQGQTNPKVKYIARGSGYTAFLTADETVFAMDPHTTNALSGKQGSVTAPNSEKGVAAAVHVKLIGGNPKAEVEAASELPGHSNYFIGNDPSKWQHGVKQYAEVSYRGVYPGVDMKFHGQQRQLEFDFILAAGANAAPIRFGVTGVQDIKTDESGNLVLSSAAGDVLLHKPVAYQEKDAEREPVDARFVVKAKNIVEFELGSYDPTRELVIDPSVSYATYLGGTAEDDAYGIAIDSSGNAYVTGQTASTNFPTVAGAYSTTNAGSTDVFVSKISPNGSSLVYSTYVGGPGGDSGNAIAVDASGNAYVTGGAHSGFPTTSGAYRTIFGGQVDAFVLELDSSGGTLTFSTYVGAAGVDIGTGIAVDTTGVYIVGSTSSTNFKTTPGAIQTSINGTSNGFVTKLNSSGSALVYSTYLGGGSNDNAIAVAVDSANQAYVTGVAVNPTFPTTSGAFQTTCGTDGTCNGGVADAFVSVINAAGSAFVYSTFLGGSGIDEGLGIAVDSAGDAYVTGFTQSGTNFPTKSPLQSFGGGTQNAFVTELNPTGSALVYSTFLGGELSDAGAGIAVDAANNAYVTGQTSSTHFPVTSGAPQSTLGGQNDAFVSEIAASGSSLVFSTYLGGALNEDTNASSGNLAPVGGIAVDSAGANIYVAGNTVSTNFPTAGAFQTANGGGTDAFVAKYATGVVASTFTVANGSLSNTSGNPGVTATSTITVTSTGGFNSAVTLACSVSPSVTNGPTCNFSNPGATVTPPANSTATATLNVGTTAASASLMQHSGSGVLYAMILPVFGLTLVGAGMKSTGTRRTKILGLLLLGLVLAGLLVMPACGGSNSKTGGGGTPAGSYTITVTGTSGTTVVNGGPALTLTVN